MDDTLPPDPIQALINEKHAYLVTQKNSNIEWRSCPDVYPILLSLPFIKQRANNNARTTFRPRKRNLSIRKILNLFLKVLKMEMKLKMNKQLYDQLHEKRNISDLYGGKRQ